MLHTTEASVIDSSFSSLPALRPQPARTECRADLAVWRAWLVMPRNLVVRNPEPLESCYGSRCVHIRLSSRSLIHLAGW